MKLVELLCSVTCEEAFLDASLTGLEGAGFESPPFYLVAYETILEDLVQDNGQQDQ